MNWINITLGDFYSRQQLMPNCIGQRPMYYYPNPYEGCDCCTHCRVANISCPFNLQPPQGTCITHCSKWPRQIISDSEAWLAQSAAFLALFVYIIQFDSPNNENVMLYISWYFACLVTQQYTKEREKIRWHYFIIFAKQIVSMIYW